MPFSYDSVFYHISLISMVLTWSLTFCMVVLTSCVLSVLKCAVPTRNTLDPLGHSNTLTVSGREDMMMAPRERKESQTTVNNLPQKILFETTPTVSHAL